MKQRKIQNHKIMQDTWVAPCANSLSTVTLAILISSNLAFVYWRQEENLATERFLCINQSMKFSKSHLYYNQLLAHRKPTSSKRAASSVTPFEGLKIPIFKSASKATPGRYFSYHFIFIQAKGQYGKGPLLSTSVRNCGRLSLLLFVKLACQSLWLKRNPSGFLKCNKMLCKRLQNRGM